MGQGGTRELLICVVSLIFTATLSFAQQTPSSSELDTALAGISSLRTQQMAFNHGSDASSEAGNALFIRKSQSKVRKDVNRGIYYPHKLELSIEGADMPINVPFMFDFLLGNDYTMEALRYTMIPVKVTLRYQFSKVSGPKFLRGTWDATFGGTYTRITRGPESRYFGYMMGFRRNFVQRRFHAVPYLDGSVGIGNIDARAPRGVRWAQGQDLTFSIYIDSGVRYNINSRYALSIGAGYMHISNLYLSEPKYLNYGINVVGPTFGLDYRFGRRRERPPD